MHLLIPVALFGWIPFVLLLFLMLPARRAIIVAYLAAWLFLPVYSYSLPGIPDYSKMSATNFGVLLGAALFDLERILAFRFRWFDLPVAVYCGGAFVTSVLNDLGAYDGAASAFENFTRLGIPYFVGRVYFNNEQALRDLAVGIFIGGLIYVPLCLWEVRMSPQLHATLYGQHQNVFGKLVRYGGYRPIVFMQSALKLVQWLTTAAIVGFWLWRSGTLRELFGFPTPLFLLGLLVTIALCKTFVAFIIVPLGFGFLWFMSRRNATWPVKVFLAMLVGYMAIRATGLWDGQGLVELARKVDEQRAWSLQIRVDNENAMGARALERPWFGWGGWRRSWPRDPSGNTLVRPDGFWIITLGMQGLVGLAALCGYFIVPVWRFLRNYPPRYWSSPTFAPAAALCIVAALAFLYNIPNSSVNPIITLAAGGLVALPGAHVAMRRAELARRARKRRAIEAQPVTAH